MRRRRRDVRDALPALGFYFGVGWAEVSTMPAGELAAYLEAVKRLNRERERAAAEHVRRR